MNNKPCGECKHYNAAMFHCEKHDVMAEAHNTCEDCTAKTITNGDKIRQMSNEEFATDYATYSHIHDLYVARLCPPSGKLYTTMEEAIQANLAWLNAPAESEGKDE